MGNNNLKSALDTAPGDLTPGLFSPKNFLFLGLLILPDARQAKPPSEKP
jgi:hypothetical protein